MTVAVCLQCGAFKHGAFNRCRKCGYTPNDDESLTKHLLVTDHYLSRDELEGVSAKVKQGERIQFAPETLKQAWVSKKLLDAQMKKLNRGCLIGCLVPLAMALAAIGVYFWRQNQDLEKKVKELAEKVEGGKEKAKGEDAGRRSD
jgi:hypothetical protein